MAGFLSDLTQMLRKQKLVSDVLTFVDPVTFRGTSPQQASSL